MISAGKPYPIGATLCADGVNFAVFSQSAEWIDLCLFDENGAETRFRLPEKSGSVFHGFVAGIAAGQRYGFRAAGQGAYFNPAKLLLDPYAKAVDGKPVLQTPAQRALFHHGDPQDNAAVAPKSVVVQASDFDWENDQHPDTAWAKTLIYEAHVKGLTKRFPDLAHGGTYRALADARVVDYLKDLGVTAVQLLPVQLHADEYRLQAMGLKNYWGYNTLSHFAVETDYAVTPATAADEFRAAVKALHAAGLEVILDVVYNHTAEQDEHGAMLCQRGLDNAQWYWTAGQGGAYENWSGCGNTLRLADRDVSRWLADSLRYWVNEFHVDGFRFDLAAVLGREPDFQAAGRVLNLLYQDPVLAPRKLIAEAWDLGAYCVGGFLPPFAEWNDRFRDDVRRFWLGGSGDVAALATRLAGSSDRFGSAGRKPSASVNFITAHDGFTLHDLTAYNEKHNHANGENNQDGHNDNFSHNHGAEGNTADAGVLMRRRHAAQAMLATLLLAKGTPMLTAGDEFGNSQGGNNNAYCQDNETAWLDWHRFDADWHDTTRRLIALRREMDVLNEDVWLDDTRVRWLSASGSPMTQRDWHDRTQHTLQVLLDNQWLILINGRHRPQDFRLPEGSWQCRNDIAVSPQADTFRAEHMGVWLFSHSVEPTGAYL